MHDLQSQTSSSKAATDDPVWVRREKEKAAGGGGDLPFGVYLLLSSIVAIAAVRVPPITSLSDVLLMLCHDGPLAIIA